MGEKRKDCCADCPNSPHFDEYLCWRECFTWECWELNEKPRPEVSPSTEGYDGWMEKEVEKR